MTKEEILAELKKRGELDRRQRSETWMKAFELYNASVPRSNKLNPSCGSCYSKLRNWLMS